MKKLFALIIIVFTLHIVNAQVKISAGEFNYSFDAEFICGYSEGNDSTNAYIQIDSDSLVYYTITIDRQNKNYKYMWKKIVALKDIDMHLTWVNEEADSQLYFLDLIAKLPGTYVHSCFTSFRQTKTQYTYEEESTIRIACNNKNQAYDLLEKLK